MKNRIEKGKGQLKGLGLIVLILGALFMAGGIVLIATCGVSGKLSVISLVFGIILTLLGIAGVIIGIVFTWVASAVKATKGSIAEDNLGMGTVNMTKCQNCGVEVEEGKTICAKCEENLK